MSRAEAVRIRALRADEMDLCVDLAAGEGWNPGLHDAVSFRAADPGGFLVAELDTQDGPERVGCISAVAYGESFGFLGLYIVRPGYRGRGYGLALWKAGMERLAGRNVGLDGVVALQDNYARSGFVRAHRSIRFMDARPAATARSSSAVDLADVDRAGLHAYDRTCFPEERETFLEAWLGAPGTRALAWLDDGWLAGFGAIRPCRKGFKVGPLFADHRRAAEGLYDALCGAVNAPERGPVFLDVPEPHAEALALARDRCMERVFETARMYTGGEPDMDASRIWGVTSFELG